jgi:hypothetical protein
MEATVKTIGVLTTSDTAAMLQLMQDYYLNVDEGVFRSDLAEKDRVIMLSESGALCGFSTWKLFGHTCDGQQVNVIYSGDTITDSDHRSSLALPVAWGRLMMDALERDPETPLYWLLSSKGYKTYRFLPVFFRSFYPSSMHEPSVFEKSLIFSLAKRRYGDRFDPESLIVRAGPDAQRLRPGVGDVTSERLGDKHVSYFWERNPNYAQGDELVCLTRCAYDNVTKFMLRQLLK